jgi:hypothetical protein
MHILASIGPHRRTLGDPTSEYVHRLVTSLPLAEDTVEDVNWLMVANFKENPEEFDRNKMVRLKPPPGRTSFERVLDDDLVPQQ